MNIPEIWEQHGTTIVAAVVAIVAIAVAVKLLSPKKKVFAEGMTLNARCRSCGWQGTVTKYNKSCRKCAGQDLEQLGGGAS